MPQLIFNQHQIPKNQLRYGLRASAAVGCGWIATYNALALMGYCAEPQDLIRFYEHQLPLIHGTFGTSFWGPAACLRQWGFPVRVVLHREQFDEAAKNAPVCILFYRWHDRHRLGAHFVALQHTEQGFVGYNTYRSSVGPDCYGASLESFLRRKKYFGAVLITVQDLPGAKKQGSTGKKEQP